MVQRKPAFTLLELLTVIGILGLLIAILVPSLSAARRSAKANVCLSSLRGIGTGFRIYLNENEDKFPPHQIERAPPDADELFVNEFHRQAPRWQWFIETDKGPVIDPRPYQYKIRAAGFFNDQTVGRPHGGRGTTMTNDVFTCPSLADEEYAKDIRDGAYGYNYQYLGNTRHDRIPSRWDNFPVGLHRIRKTGMTVLAADSRGAGRRHGRHSFTLDPPRLATERDAGRFGPSRDTFDPDQMTGDVPEGLNADVYAYSPVEMRHSQRGNVLFVDSHADTMTLTQLGYYLSDEEELAGVPYGTAIPVYDPEDYDPGEGKSVATNRMWNGDGVDRMIEDRGSD